MRRLYDDPDPWVAAIARVMRAAIAINLGTDSVPAAAECRTALEAFTALGERWGMSLAHSVLGQFLGVRGDHAAAAEHYERALELTAELGAEEDRPQLGGVLAHELWVLGETDRAREVLAEARRRAERVGLAESLGAVDYVEGEFARRSGDLAAARELLERAAVAAATPGVARQWRAGVAGSLGAVALAEGDLAAARAHLAHAVTEAVGSADAPVIAQVLVPVAELAVRTGDPARAAALLGAAEGILGLPEPPSLTDGPRVTAAALAALGDTAFAEAYQSGRSATIPTIPALAALTAT
jgi:tetratricopeptide (TPR) repeat protein